MNITVVAVGKIRERFFAAAVEEYQKRLRPYCKLEILELPDEKAPEQAGEALREQIRKKEGERILRCLREDALVVTLEIEGEQLSSQQLAQRIEQWGIAGKSHIMFVIGGSLGLSGEVCKKADFHLSFSKMTFPHQLMRVVLLEQIYRSYRIIHRQPYHK